MSAKNCRCRESHPLSGWMIVAGLVVFATLANAEQKGSSDGRLEASGQDANSPGAGDTTAGGAPFAGSVGCPVSTSIGEYYFTKPLMNLGGPLPVEFSLYYASRIQKGTGSYNDPFGGDGFTHNYQVALRLLPGTPDTVWILTREGNTIFFHRSGATWKIESEEVIYQLKESDGYYYLMDPVWERVYTFQKATVMGGSQVGALVRLEDRNGNALTFTNTPSGPYLLPTRVVDGLGRFLEFTYQDPTQNGQYPHLSKVTDQNGRTIQFRYDVTIGNPSSIHLKSVTDAAGQTTSFSYAGSLTNSVLAAQTLPLGNVPHRQTYEHETMPAGNVADWPWRVAAQTDAYGNATRLSYNDAEGATTITNPLGETSRHIHENQRLLTTWTDEKGHSVNLRYDSLGRPTSVVDRLGNTTQIAYHPETGKIAAYTDTEGNTTTFTYGVQPQTFTNPVADETVPFTFYHLTEVAYADGSHEQFTYDAQGNVLTRTDRNNQTWSFTYNGRGQPLTRTNPSGGRTTYAYNADALLTSRSDSDTRVTYFAYDALQRPSVATRPDGTTVRFTYDLSGRLLSVTDERGQTTSFSYDANGNLAATSNPLNETMTYVSDLMDRPSTRTDPLGRRSTLTYGPLGQLASRTDCNGNITAFRYDSRGWLTGVTDPAGNTWTTACNDEGFPTAFTTPTGRSMTFQTDQLGRLTGITDPLGAAAKFTYDERGRVTSTTSRLGRVTTCSYDAAGRLTSVTKSLLGTAAYARNALGRLTRITDLRGKDWDFSYSSMGRLTSDTDPLGNWRDYAYDSRGRLWQIIFPGGYAVTLTRDEVGRPTRAAFPDGLTLELTYDDAGRLLTANNVTLRRDARGDIIDSRDGAASFGATYDAGRRPSTVTYDGHATVTYTYDARDLLTRVSDSLSGAWMEFRYDADGQVVEVRRSNSVTTTYSFDRAGRLIRLQDGTYADQQYTLNAEGEATQAAMKVPLGAATIGYVYDAAGRLTDADYGGGNRLTYTYDPGGNLLTATGRTPLEPSPRTDSFSYDAASQIQSPGYDCDILGRLTTAPGRAFTYDSLGRLTSITVGNSTPTFTYNGLEDLRTSTAGGTTTAYYHNYALRLSPVVAEKQGTTYTRFYVYTPGGRLLYSIDAGTKAVRFYHFDRVGSTLFLTDGTGTVTDSYTYDPYGRLLGRTGLSDQPFTYVGAYGVRWEPAGNLYHMRSRCYDPTTARFLTRDLRQPGPYDPRSLNPYPYATENPLRYVDPQGTCPVGASCQGFEAFNESALWWLSMSAEEMSLEGILTLTGESRQPGEIFYDPDFNAWYGVMENPEGSMTVSDLMPDALKAAELNAVNSYVEQYGSFLPGVTFQYLSREYGLQFADVIDSMTHGKAKAASTE